MRCERCFPHIIEMQRDGICVLEQADDGQDFLTLTIMEGGKQRTFALTEKEFAPLVGESWPVVLEGIASYEVDVPEPHNQLDQERATSEGMPPKKD